MAGNFLAKLWKIKSFSSKATAVGNINPPAVQKSEPCRKITLGKGGMVVGISMVKNEDDIIEQFVRHNLQFVDSLVILDNGSVDDTQRILRFMQEEGLPILILDDPISSYIQDQKMTRLLRAVTSSFFPEFVVPLDADEFIACKSRNVFLETLRQIPSGAVGLVPWQTYVVLPSYGGRTFEDLPRNFVSRRVSETPQFFKAMARTDGCHATNIAFSQGNHHATTNTGELLPSIHLAGVKLAHYPVRSPNQVAAKGIITAMATLEKNPNSEKEGVCFQHFTILRKCQSSTGIQQSDLPELSMKYAQSRTEIDWHKDVVEDPVSYNYVRRYNAPEPMSVLAKVTKSWEFSIFKGKSLGDELNGLVINKREEVTAGLKSAGSSILSTAFDPLWHYEHSFVDIAPFQVLADRHQFKSALDAGCGLGANLEILRRKGADDVMGIDGFPGVFSLLSKHEYFQHDLSKPFDLGRKFDLVICTEVAEHLNPGCEKDLIKSLASHAGKFILFSAAEPGQPGHGHINCRPFTYWLSCWQDAGWEPVLFDSLAFRCAATMSWLRRNAILLKPKSTTSLAADDARKKLEAISQLPYSWYGQNPGIRSFALQEELPAGLFDG
jgi:SAM-dependent methyltransferase